MPARTLAPMQLRVPSWSVVPCFAILAVAAAVDFARAQCATQWMPGSGLAGTNEFVAATTLWDADGPGPLPPVLVAAGGFTIAGTVQASRIVRYDPVTAVWTPLGTGMDFNVSTLATLANGDLVAGGSFTTAGGVPANRVARWNGVTWSALGSGMNGAVDGLATLSNGDLVACGQFTTAGGAPANRIARWNGTSWSALGVGMNGSVHALQTLPNGSLVAGGAFTFAGGAPANRIAIWNGLTWSALGAGTNNSVGALTTLPNGDLIAGGTFTAAGGAPANFIARWDGASWSSLGSGTDAFVFRLLTSPTGDVVAGGSFTMAGGAPASRIARWNGLAWSSLGSGTDQAVEALATLPNGDLVAGGSFSTAGGGAASRLARWNGASWSALATGGNNGMNNEVRVLSSLPNGDLLAGGAFTAAGGVPANRVARWNGTTWSALGAGISGPPVGPAAVVQCVTTLANGDIVVGGFFDTAGGAPAANIARWDGTNWSALGTGTDAAVLGLATLPNGDLVAGGSFTTAGGVPAARIARWNGTSWSALGAGIAGGTNPVVKALLTTANGDLVAGGVFTTAGGAPAASIARWEGISWSPLGTGINLEVAALTTLPNGDLVAGGYFTMISGAPGDSIARWNGASWAPFGAGIGMPPFAMVRALATLPNGDLVAGGLFTTAGAVTADCLARWNGTTWSSLGLNPGFVGVAALTMERGRFLVAGGQFTSAGGLASAFIARLTTTCPATAATFGNGCPSSGGSNTLVADTPPWVGGTFRATGTGLPATAIVVALTSVASVPQGVAPLAAFFPQAGPGCDVLTFPEIVTPLLTTTGALVSSFPLPNTPLFVGLTFYHQLVPIELDPQGGWVAVTATNALQLTAGAF